MINKKTSYLSPPLLIANIGDQIRKNKQSHGAPEKTAPTLLRRSMRYSVFGVFSQAQ